MTSAAEREATCEAVPENLTAAQARGLQELLARGAQLAFSALPR